MSTEHSGPWAWRLRDLRGEPGPWHMEVHQRPALAGGDNIEVIDIPEMAEEIKRLKAALRHEIRTTDKAEAERDELKAIAYRAIDALEDTHTGSVDACHHCSICDIPDALRAAIEGAEPAGPVED